MGNLIVLSMPRSKSNKVTKSISVPQPIADRVIELAPDSEAELYVELIQRGLRMYEGKRVKSLELDLQISPLKFGKCSVFNQIGWKP